MKILLAACAFALAFTSMAEAQRRGNDRDVMRFQELRFASAEISTGAVIDGYASAPVLRLSVNFRCDDLQRFASEYGRRYVLGVSDVDLEVRVDRGSWRRYSLRGLSNGGPDDRFCRFNELNNNVNGQWIFTPPELELDAQFQGVYLGATQAEGNATVVPVRVRLLPRLIVSNSTDPDSGFAPSARRFDARGRL